MIDSPVAETRALAPLHRLLRGKYLLVGILWRHPSGPLCHGFIRLGCGR